MPARKKRVDIKNSATSERKEYMNTLQKIVVGGFCPFCEQNLPIHHKPPILIKSAHWLVTPSMWPYKGSRHHFLFITRAHVEHAGKLSPAQWTDLHKNMQRITKKYRLNGATLMMRSGNTAITGATVNHLHAHLIVGGVRKKNAPEIKTVVGFST